MSPGELFSLAAEMPPAEPAEPSAEIPEEVQEELPAEPPEEIQWELPEELPEEVPEELPAEPDKPRGPAFKLPDLSGKIPDLTGKIRSLTGKMPDLTGRISGLTGKISGLTDKIRSLIPARGKETRGTKPNRRRRLSLVTLPMLFILIAAVAVTFFVRSARSYDFDEGASQFYAGGEYKIPGGAVMRRGEGVSTIYYGGVTRDATNLPIYRSDENTVVLPQDMVYYDPRGGLVAKTDYFTELLYDANGSVTVVRGGASRRADLGFLYDGRDTYLFLEPVTVTLNGYRTELSAMSYAEAVYDGQVTLYDRESGTFTIEEPGGEVVCRAMAGDYTLSLLGDYFEKADGVRTLLFTKPELLDSFFK
jgi:hypothetical protein